MPSRLNADSVPPPVAPGLNFLVKCIKFGIKRGNLIHGTIPRVLLIRLLHYYAIMQLDWMGFVPQSAPKTAISFMNYYQSNAGLI